MSKPVAALFVAPGGPYYNIDGVIPWGPPKDARDYDGPWPVVAHPPCARWGRYWYGGPSCKIRKKLGDDQGCFEAALKAVRKYGGVIEHPEASHAWGAFDINKPPKNGGWVNADFYGGFTCCVEQGHYGHRARKATWLYVFGVSTLPDLKWGKAKDCVKLEDGFHSNEERVRARVAGLKPKKRITEKERIFTPLPFRDVLISIAQNAEMIP